MFVFLSQLSLLRQFLLRFLSTSLLAWHGPTYHGNSVRHRVFVFPYQSLLCHLSLFSVIARSRTAVVFLTLESFSSVGCTYEDERETLCIVSVLKEAASSDIGNHSSQLSSLSLSPAEGRSSRLTLIIHASISLFFLHFLCVLCKTFATDVNMYDLGVYSPPNGRKMASDIALSDTF